jgi:hypothetical protein
MELLECPESSTIIRCRYDGDAQILEVEFKSGTTYRYFDVPAPIFEQMKTAPSKGQFLAQTIKGAYRYARA